MTSLNDREESKEENHNLFISANAECITLRRGLEELEEEIQDAWNIGEDDRAAELIYLQILVVERLKELLDQL